MVTAGGAMPSARDRLGRRAALGAALAAAAVVLLYFAALGSFPLFEPDEGRYAEIPREMLATGDLLTPRLDGVLYFEKPPLYYWLNAGALATGAPMETAVRLWSVLFALGGAGLAYALGREMSGAPAGLAAAAALATSPLYFALGRIATLDMTVTFFLTATLACFWLAHGRPRGVGERLLWYGMFAAAALAVLTKGLIGVVIPGAVVALYLLFTRRWRVLAAVPWLGGILLFLAVAAPWHLWMAAHHPRFLWFYFVHEHLLRYATDATHRWQPAWFFIPVLLLGFLPWSGLTPAAATLGDNRTDPGEAGRNRRPALVFLACWAGFVFVFFSASRSKLIPYVLPALPPLAVLTGLAVVAAAEGDPRGARMARVARVARRGAIGAGLALGAGAAALGWAALGRVPSLPMPLAPLAVAAAALAATAALAAVGLAWRRRGTASFAALLVASAAFCATIGAAGARYAPSLSTDQLAATLASRLAPTDEVATYDVFPETLPVYLARMPVVVDYRGELEFGISSLPEGERIARFPTVAEFAERWRGPRTVYLVTRARGLPRMQAAGLEPGPVLARQGDLVLTSNQPAGEP